MKSKVLLSMLIVLIVLAGLGIMCGTVFVVREVQVVDYNASVLTLSPEQKEQIATKSELQGKNILFNLKTDKIVERVKTVDPFLKVQAVQAKFPNKVVITIAKRVPVFQQGSCFFDAEMYIVPEGTNPAGCVHLDDKALVLKNANSKGDFALGDSAKDIRKIAQLKTVAGYFQQINVAINNWEIAFNDSIGHSVVEMHITFDQNKKMILRTKENENFDRMLPIVWSVYQNPRYPATDSYEAFYSVKGKVIIYDAEGKQVYYEK